MRNEVNFEDNPLFYCNVIYLDMMDVGTDIIRYKVLLDR